MTETQTPGKKTILLFSANYLPTIGGVEKFTASLSSELEKLGHHAIIVTNNTFNLPEQETLATGAEIYRLPCLSIIDGRLPIPHKTKKYKQLVSKITQINVDYILINARFYPHSLLGAKIAKKKNITPIILDHGSNYLTLNNTALDYIVKLYEHAITALLKKYCGAYYGISQASLNWLKTFKITGSGVISNAIDADDYFSHASTRDYRNELKLPDGSFIVSFTGRLIKEKGILPMLEAAEFFLQKDPSIHFVIAGDGPLKKHIVEKNLPNTHYVGKITPPDIAALLVQSNVFCLPSRSEGFSTSLLEASSCYAPSITTNVGGAAELFPNINFGITLNSATKKEIVESIYYLKQHPEQASAIGANAGNRVRELFSWNNTVSHFLDACMSANPNQETTHSHS